VQAEEAAVAEEVEVDTETGQPAETGDDPKLKQIRKEARTVLLEKWYTEALAHYRKLVAGFPM
jgi:hypothetical protein